MRIINTIKGSALLKSGITITAAKGSVIVANFLIFYILVRICSPEDFGTWVLYTSLIAIFDIAVSSFIDNAIIKFYSDYQDDTKGKFVFNSITFTIFLTLVVSLLLYLSIFLFDGLYKSDSLNTLLWLGPLMLLPSGVINVMNSIEQGNSKFYGQLVLSVLRSGIFFLYLFFLYITDSHYKLQHFVFVNIAAALIAMIVIFIMTKKYLALTYNFDFSIIRKLA